MSDVITGEVPVPQLDQLLKVASQHQLFYKPANGAEWRRKLDTIHHRGPRRILTELMHVAESPKGTLDLFIDEIVRRLHLGDPTRHLKWNSEMPGPPGDVLT